MSREAFEPCVCFFFGWPTCLQGEKACTKVQRHKTAVGKHGSEVLGYVVATIQRLGDDKLTGDTNRTQEEEEDWKQTIR